MLTIIMIIMCVVGMWLTRSNNAKVQRWIGITLVCVAFVGAASMVHNSMGGSSIKSTTIVQDEITCMADLSEYLVPVYHGADATYTITYCTTGVGEYGTHVKVGDEELVCGMGTEVVVHTHYYATCEAEVSTGGVVHGAAAILALLSMVYLYLGTKGGVKYVPLSTEQEGQEYTCNTYLRIAQRHYMDTDDSIGQVLVEDVLMGAVEGNPSSEPSMWELLTDEIV